MLLSLSISPPLTMSCHALMACSEWLTTRTRRVKRKNRCRMMLKREILDEETEIES